MSLTKIKQLNAYRFRVLIQICHRGLGESLFAYQLQVNMDYTVTNLLQCADFSQ